RIASESGWLSENPTSGTVPPAGSVAVQAIVNTAGLLGGNYVAKVIANSNDPVNPTVEKPVVSMFVSGESNIVTTPDQLTFPQTFVGNTSDLSLNVENTGTGVLDVTNVTSTNSEFSVNMTSFTVDPLQNIDLLVSFSPTVPGTPSGWVVIESNDPDTPLDSTWVEGDAVLGPEIGVNPSFIDETLSPDDSVDVLVEISNNAPAGAANLDWSATIAPVMENSSPVVLGEVAPNEAINSQYPPDAHPLVGTQSNGTVPTDQDVSLILDDGSRENSIGLTAGGQFLWFNRFTPAPSDFPFTLEEVQILFGMGVGVNVGEEVDIYVYEDTDGDGDPGTGAVVLGQLNNAAVQFVDDVNFSVYAFPPTQINGPGDVLIAVVNRTAGIAAGTFPAAIDQTASQVRSWVGTYTVGDPPDPPTLPADDLWGTIDSFGLAGNWMVRGFGSQGADWIELIGPTAGSVSPGDMDNVTVRLRSAGLALDDTTVTSNVKVTSNDVNTPIVDIPVSLTVTVVGIEDVAALPTTFDVSPNYPNPFNPTTKIKYQLPQNSDVKLVIYNVLGQKVRTLLNSKVEAGYHEVVWDGRSDVGGQVATGIYIYRFEAGDFQKTMKMILMK
ncbi:MAG: FlgD immunoglobulin-like domain containing protein, partial [Calditrichia bacterium]